MRELAGYNSVCSLLFWFRWFSQFLFSFLIFGLCMRLVEARKGSISLFPCQVLVFLFWGGRGGGGGGYSCFGN